MAKPVNHSYGQTYSCNHTDNTVTKTNNSQSTEQLHGYRTDHKVATSSHKHSQCQHAWQYAAHGMVCYGKTKKMKEKKAEYCKKKEKSMTKKKYKDDNRSYSDGSSSSSSSDSDSD
ncbi:hypothetical protein TorRG33x02_027800 [Trema orientale]|uniref:Uncharacterized protein n=1 Tax=Trema orientale TaxID=63057 RepID=A0A2P5FUJ3_TREOI|nr:hypothetical protein TorRG33x02_027800 [Trema orientale]